MRENSHGAVGVRHGSLDELVQQLSPSDQRLVRELVFKLAGRPPQEPPVAENTQPQDLTGYVQAWASRLTLEDKSPGTVKVYVNMVLALLRAHPSPTPDDIEAFLLELGKRCGPGRVANMLFALNSFYLHLMRKGIVTSSPVGDLKAPPVPLRVRDIPTTEQIARLLNAPTVTVKDRAIILVLAACGLRAAELVKARRRDLDLERRRITVIGKNNKQRVLPMSKQAADMLEQYLKSAPSSEWLFPGRDPQKTYRQQSLDNRFADLSSRAGIQRVVPHHLRHYFASYLLNHGMSLKDVSMLLGHASPSVTANVYWHTLGEEERVKAYEQHDPLQEIKQAVVQIATTQLVFDFEQSEANNAN
jgi:site-specific recombinase XerD